MSDESDRSLLGTILDLLFGDILRWIRGGLIVMAMLFATEFILSADPGILAIPLVIAVNVAILAAVFAPWRTFRR